MNDVRPSRRLGRHERDRDTKASSTAYRRNAASRLYGIARNPNRAICRGDERIKIGHRQHQSPQRHRCDVSSFHHFDDHSPGPNPMEPLTRIGRLADAPHPVPSGFGNRSCRAFQRVGEHNHMVDARQIGQRHSLTNRRRRLYARWNGIDCDVVRSGRIVVVEHPTKTLAIRRPGQ